MGREQAPKVNTIGSSRRPVTIWRSGVINRDTLLEFFSFPLTDGRGPVFGSDPPSLSIGLESARWGPVVDPLAVALADD